MGSPLSCSSATGTSALIGELREAGAKVQLIRDGDVAPAIAAAQSGTGVDMLYGIGGTPEGVISAAALKCVGGGIQGKLWPRDDEERARLVDAGLDPDRVLTTDDLVAGEDVFVAATGVTDGPRCCAESVISPNGGADRTRSSCARRPARRAGSRRTTCWTSFEALTGRQYR